jgi:hypothetical protein
MVPAPEGEHGTDELRVELSDVMDFHSSIHNEVTVTLDVKTVVIPLDGCGVVAPEHYNLAQMRLRRVRLDILSEDAIASDNATKLRDSDDFSSLIHDVLLVPNRPCERRESRTLLS